MPPFDSIHYLQNGNPTQLSAFLALTRAEIMGKMAPFQPLLVGTIPIAIDIPGSDLDILCWDPDLNVLEANLIMYFAQFPQWKMARSVARNGPCIVASFRLDGFEVEIFGATIPSHEQYGYLHMIVEYQLLEELGTDFRQKIVALKLAGMKTEPAFAHLLQLEGDPFEALIAYGLERKWIPV